MSMDAVPHRSLNILLVDDDDVDVMNVQRAFRRANLTNPLHLARDGVQALAMLRDGTVPASRLLVLLDLNMPRMNGIEFLRELRADPALRHISVVALTTSSEEQDKVEAYQLHVAGYLVKPVTFTTFVELMSVLQKYWTLMEMP
ncbi:response regulator [Ideonella sp.]|uniref:response regulator n=1 Tax=Ideonella sp. TaxID=1929293 RepID=UPI0035B30B2A